MNGSPPTNSSNSLPVTPLSATLASAAVLVGAYFVWTRWQWKGLLATPLPVDCAVTSPSLKERRVVVLGSGVSGLVTAKTFLQFGYTNVIVLE